MRIIMIDKRMIFPMFYKQLKLIGHSCSQWLRGQEFEAGKLPNNKDFSEDFNLMAELYDILSKFSGFEIIIICTYLLNFSALVLSQNYYKRAAC